MIDSPLARSGDLGLEADPAGLEGADAVDDKALVRVGEEEEAEVGRGEPAAEFGEGGGGGRRAQRELEKAKREVVGCAAVRRNFGAVCARESKLRDRPFKSRDLLAAAAFEPEVGCHVRERGAEGGGIAKKRACRRGAGSERRWSRKQECGEQQRPHALLRARSRAGRGGIR